ncbi:matrix protein [Cuevavirus lloviuense]|uniref:Matrix protein VP40 n=1 Tax=Cuevavirus lloviuense TaxID=3052148 RepID=G8EFI3_9MONO|nr:matrix protein [Cuevavirus lloviuense]AER23673.1 VP40 [Cuevavirus lloviuense]UJP71083.1 viral protein 40 [synthetic construct]
MFSKHVTLPPPPYNPSSPEGLYYNPDAGKKHGNPHSHPVPHTEHSRASNTIRPTADFSLDYDSSSASGAISAFMLEAYVNVISNNKVLLKLVPLWLPLGVAGQDLYSFDSTASALLIASYTITHFGMTTRPLVRVNRLGPGIPDHPLHLLRLGNQAFLQELVLPPLQLPQFFTFELTELRLYTHLMPQTIWIDSAHGDRHELLRPGLSVNPRLRPILLPCKTGKKVSQHEIASPDKIKSVANYIKELKLVTLDATKGVYALEIPEPLFEKLTGKKSPQKGSSTLIPILVPRLMSKDDLGGRDLVMSTKGSCENCYYPGASPTQPGGEQS